MKTSIRTWGNALVVLFAVHVLPAAHAGANCAQSSSWQCQQQHGTTGTSSARQPVPSVPVQPRPPGTNPPLGSIPTDHHNVVLVPPPMQVPPSMQQPVPTPRPVVAPPLITNAVPTPMQVPPSMQQPVPTPRPVVAPPLITNAVPTPMQVPPSMQQPVPTPRPVVAPPLITNAVPTPMQVPPSMQQPVPTPRLVVAPPLITNAVPTAPMQVPPSMQQPVPTPRPVVAPPLITNSVPTPPVQVPPSMQQPVPTPTPMAVPPVVVGSTPGSVPTTGSVAAPVTQPTLQGTPAGQALPPDGTGDYQLVVHAPPEQRPVTSGPLQATGAYAWEFIEPGIQNHRVEVYRSKDVKQQIYKDVIPLDGSGFHLTVIGIRRPHYSH